MYNNFRSAVIVKTVLLNIDFSIFEFSTVVELHKNKLIFKNPGQSC